MKLNPNDIELIEKSIEGSMNDDEASMFEERYKTSEDFRECVRLQRSLLSSLEANHKAKIKGELTQMLKEVDPESKVVSISNRWYMLAASVAIFIGVIWISNLENDSSKKLFDEYYEPFPAQGFVRGDISKSETDEILHFYSGEKYQETIDKILALDGYEQSFDGQMLYLGNSYLALSQNEKAIQTFQDIDEESKYYFDSQWYLALAFLAKDDTEESMKILNTLLQENSIYTTSARSLLTDLKENE